MMQCRSWMEHDLKRKLSNGKNPLATLKYLCSGMIVCVSFQPNVYGFSIPVASLGYPDDRRYFFAVYCKIPDVRMLYVDDNLYLDEDLCFQKAKFYVRYFPIYGFSSRNIFHYRDKSTL